MEFTSYIFTTDNYITNLDNSNVTVDQVSQNSYFERETNGYGDNCQQGCTADLMSTDSENLFNKTTLATVSVQPKTIFTPLNYVGFSLTLILLIIGVAGNVFTVHAMLSKQFRKLAVSNLLIALAISDMSVNILLPFNKLFLRKALGFDIRSVSNGSCRLFYWAYRMSKMSSSWMIVFITCERFVAVWLPHKSNQISTWKNARMLIIILYSTFGIFVGYWCSWADRLVNGVCIPNAYTASKEKMTGGFLVFGLSLYAFIPSVALLVLNALIVMKLYSRPKLGNSESSSASAHNNKRITIIMVGISIAFVLLVTPISSAHIVNFVRKTNIFETSDPLMVFYREVGSFMEQLNNSINFVFYVLFSKRFRDHIVSLLRCNKKNSVHPLVETSVLQ